MEKSGPSLPFLLHKQNDRTNSVSSYFMLILKKSNETDNKKLQKHE